MQLTTSVAEIRFRPRARLLLTPFCGVALLFFRPNCINSDYVVIVLPYVRKSLDLFTFCGARDFDF